MAFSPCLEKSRSSAQITASLSLLREPGFLPAGLPDYASALSLRQVFQIACGTRLVGSYPSPAHTILAESDLGSASVEAGGVMKATTRQQRSFGRKLASETEVRSRKSAGAAALRCSSSLNR
jgi:hypothetical protein